MNRIIILTLLCLCGCFTRQNNTNTAIKQLQSEYLSIDKLSEWDFIKAKEKDLYMFSFAEDSLPYIITEDSLFKIKVNDEMYVLYYNCSLLQNTGFIMYGTYDNREIHLIQIGTIISCEAYMVNQKLLLKIAENLQAFAFDYPIAINTNHLLFTIETHSLQDDFSVLSEASVLHDTAKIQLQVGLADNNVFVNGVQNGKQVSCVIKIEENGFAILKQEETIQWNNINVFERKRIYPKSLTF